MSISGLLQTVVSRLNSVGIPYMLTGPMAAAIHGAGRATLAIDVVIEADAERLRELVASLSGPEFYVSDEAVMDAIAHESMFNVVEVHTGWKADLIIRKSRPFSESEFARRQPVVLDDIELWVVSVEDLIIAKLEWARLGGSARQIEDVSRLVQAAGGELDGEYLNRWVGQLGLQSEWQLAAQSAR